MNEIKKVMITGGAGFLGINLIRFLLSKGYDIVSVDKADFDYPEKSKIQTVTADIRDREAMKKVMEGVDFVVHAAAALPLYSAEEIRTTNAGATKMLLNLALELGKERFVYISSTAVYGIPDHHPLVETDKMVGVGPYGEAKVEAEGYAVDAREKGLCVSVLRPKSFIGPERLGVFALFYDWAKDGKNFPMIGSGKNRYQLLDVEDLCQAIWLCLVGEKENVNDVFNVGAKEFTTMKEDYQSVLDKAGFGKKIYGFPATPLIWMLRVLEFFKLSPLYKWVYETAGKDSFVSIEKAERKLGYKPLFSNKQALVRNYEWYLQNLKNFEKSSGVSHRVPWKQGLLGVAKMFF